MTSTKQLVGKKTLITSVVIPLWVFATQMLLQQRYYTGGAAAAIATGLLALNEWVGLRNIPVDVDDLKDVSRDVGADVRDAVASNAPKGVARDPETGKFVPKDSDSDTSTSQNQ